MAASRRVRAKSAPDEIIPPARLAGGARPPFSRGTRAPAVLLAVAAAASLAHGRPPAPTQTAPWGSGEDAAAERFLLEAEIVEREELGSGVTLPLRVTLRLGDRSGRAIFKDVQEEYARAVTGSSRLDDTYFTDRWQHEVAAYRLDRLIGLGLVPPTVIRTIGGRTGSLQTWIEGAFSERDRVEKNLSLENPARFQEASGRMKAFDALIYNVDRNQRNVLIVEPGTRVHLVDHSRAFRLRKQLPIARKESLPVPAGFAERLAAPQDEAIRAALEGLLTKAQIGAILARRKAIAEKLEEERAASDREAR